MGYGYEPTKATIITNTAAHTGRFVKIMALEDSVIASITSAAITENGSSTIEGIEFDTSACIEGLEITSITLTSGTVIAYAV
ncbi:MAG: hypothetical protein Unbinned1819contig1001_9 [Prokaryotic dsDNA virus sp.]|nr:MAG: hypothetical protein Unbinned1819contig1001_9 [Prokaryotic dsDNA virus sp.]|tara:strand:+ start:5125 stop:5370 length:246 start_codon:yes stop_codon:yes gene_type:complete